jgi:hypothetical protein
MNIENLRFFGIAKDNIIKEFPPSDIIIKNFYITYPITKATLVIYNLEFESKYIGLTENTLNNNSLYNMVFFDNDIALPFGNLGIEITIKLEGCLDGSVILYDIYDPIITQS